MKDFKPLVHLPAGLFAISLFLPGFYVFRDGDPHMMGYHCLQTGPFIVIFLLSDLSLILALLAWFANPIFIYSLVYHKEPQRFSGLELTAFLLSLFAFGVDNSPDANGFSHPTYLMYGGYVWMLSMAIRPTYQIFHFLKKSYRPRKST